ncbi:B-lymphocyte antigen CD19 [Lithobates pipiens]
MLVFLLFCFCGANFVHSQEFITVSAEGNVSLPCDQSKLIPLKVKVFMGEDKNNSWVSLELNSTFLEINTTKPFLSLPADLSRNGSQTYSCYAYNSFHLKRDTGFSDVSTYQGKNNYIYCDPSDEWTTLEWFQHDHLIAKVIRGDPRINIRAVVTGPLSIAIISIITPDANQQGTVEKTTRLSCGSATGFQKFIDEKYWIIAVSALSYILFCVTAICGYMTIRRRRKAEKRRKAQERFFKVSTARNLYMESINQEPANWKQDEQYQNFSPTKDNSGDHFSNKSSFLDVSEGGDSYLEPISPEEADEISDDVDCYENANEEIKEGSIGSQSYEDMNGPKNGKSLIPEKTREEDADSYENMQAPIYSQLNRSLNSLGHSVEDEVEQTGSNMADVSPEQQWPTGTELKQLNGDFYLSYQANNF